jgi:hypothetical protein
MKKKNSVTQKEEIMAKKAKKKTAKKKAVKRKVKKKSCTCSK